MSKTKHVANVVSKGGKKYREKKTLVDKPAYPLADAVALLTKVAVTKFDGSAEVHIRIGADMTQSDQLVRGTVSLPHGTGKKVRIAAFVTDDYVDEAKKAGATHAGAADLIKQIEGGMLDFDITVAMPQLMKDLGKLAKVLGPKGLMPSPKSGTVSDKPAKVIEELSKGRIEFKMDKQAIIHGTFGKVSFGPEKLTQNLQALITAVKEAQPSGIKASYILSISINPTMGPGIKIEL
ncbi:MAG: 50S ribosomal protein L1 [Candidatus Peribacteraceae bacterium]|nr:50S ribosomal protein L1 [Candidatus Peribacteraceae bacterium]MBP9850144.1 50S ribosomal protein L1 [Candidatus Peribacteraceae bacterium]